MLDERHFSQKTPRLNIEFSNYLDGKTVAIVGRGGLDHLDQGDFIDSHDVVARVHNMCPYVNEVSIEYPTPDHLMLSVPENWRSRVGTRCEIVYYRHRKRDEDNRPLRESISEEVKAFVDNGGRFLCADCWRGHDTVGELIWQSLYETRYLTVDHWLNTMRAIGGYAPYAGTLAVTDILRHNVKQVYITGMPFWITEDDPNPDDPVGAIDHSPVNDLAFIVGLTKQFPNQVSIDDNMKRTWEIANGQLASGV